MASENDKNHRVRVAQYLRMSTDHQQYSLHNQSEYIKDYAEKNNMEIAYTYDDAGKSGVSIVGRHSLQQLLSDVEQKKIDIQAVLFYDVSRGNDSNLLIVFYVQIMPDDFVMQLHRF